MKKRKLSGQQLRRIQRKQHASTARASAGQAPEDAGDAAGLGPEQPGLVISHFGQQLEIEALEGEHRGQLFRCHQRSNLDALVAGDRVVWQPGDPVGVVVATLPRTSLLSRPNPQGELRPVAANIDSLFVVIAPRPTPFANLIDRYLVAAEHHGLGAVIVLNKLDLIEDAQAEELNALLALYEGLGYPCFRLSARARIGIDALEARLKNHTSIFVGQSGVGKSALINALLPGVNTLEGALSEAGDKGRHTTTAARLFHFPEGGDLIDSPGIREFGLHHLEAADLLAGFREFRPFLGQCRFRDCRHEQEPGCRLREALARGAIDSRRMESYRLILQSLNGGE